MRCFLPLPLVTNVAVNSLLETSQNIKRDFETYSRQGKDGTSAMTVDDRTVRHSGRAMGVSGLVVHLHRLEQYLSILYLRKMLCTQVPTQMRFPLGTRPPRAPIACNRPVPQVTHRGLMIQYKYVLCAEPTLVLTDRLWTPATSRITPINNTPSTISPAHLGITDDQHSTVGLPTHLPRYYHVRGSGH